MVTRYNVSEFVEDPNGIAVAYTDYAVLETAHAALQANVDELQQQEYERILKERYPLMTPMAKGWPILDRPVLAVNLEGKLGIFARMGTDADWEWRAQSNPVDLFDPAGIITSPVQNIFGWMYLPGFEASTTP